VPVSSSAWTEYDRPAANPRRNASRRRLSTAHRSTSGSYGAILRPERWSAGAVATGRRATSLHSTLTGVPFALAISDVVALAIGSAVVGGSPARAALFGAMVLFSRVTVRQYRQRMCLSILDDIPRALGSTMAAVGLTLAATSIFSAGPLLERQVLQRAVSFAAVSMVCTALTFETARRLRRRGKAGRRTLIVGAGRVGTTLGAALSDHPEIGLRPVGFVDPGAQAGSDGLRLPVLTTEMQALGRTILEHEIDTTILAFDGAGDAHVDTVMAVHQTGCQVLIVPSMFELHQDGPDVERVRGIPLLRLRPDPTLRPAWWIKRMTDIAVSAVGLIVLAVPMLVIALAILTSSGRPILFWQDRVGLDAKTFRLCKFRSLRPRSEGESQTTWSIAADPRLGRMGKFLRRSSIDEVPQLWNILRGQMSLVGPRPERPTFVERFSEEHERYWARHRVPVGLTGLAQVNGLRGDTSIRERARYDNCYIANWSLWLDFKIVMLTAREVLGGRGR
jgi:exopolysaccharide biosynthesis polyprenyl glycosylphosphotransferase